MKKFCAILFSFVLVLMLALPVAAEDAAGESDSLFDTAPELTALADLFEGEDVLWALTQQGG